MSFPLFGPGGNADSFYKDGKKSTLQAPEWVKSFGLDAYEYEAGRGVNASDETFAKLGEAAKSAGIALSIHAPYFISLSSVEETKRTGSARYILESANALKLMGGETMVIHAGSCAKIDRTLATEYAADKVSAASERITEVFTGLSSALRRWARSASLARSTRCSRSARSMRPSFQWWISAI